MTVTMAQAVACVKALLDKNQYHYSYDQEKKRFTLRFNLKNKLNNCEILIYVRPQSADPSLCRVLMSYGMSPISADQDSMAAVCEYLTRANYGLTIGNFELDHRDGEVRYKVSCNVREGLPGEDAVDDLIAMPVAMFNKYGNGFLAVNMGFSTPEDAAAQAEA